MPFFSWFDTLLFYPKQLFLFRRSYILYIYFHSKNKSTDFRELWPLAQRRHIGADVLNGISVSDDPDVLFVVGKRWDRMFKIRLLR